MRVTILGCGSSSGVPIIGCQCPVCTSKNSKNTRSRASILVDSDGSSILVDTSPDLRAQCLANAISSVDAIIYTHDHADHTHGIDDIRPLNYQRGAPLDVYADDVTIAGLKTRFSYAFKPPIAEYGWFRPAINPHTIIAGQPLDIAGMRVLPFTQLHGRITSLGLRFGDFTYSTDVHAFTPEAFEAIKGTRIWVVDCLKYDPVPTHSYMAQTLAWIEQIKPELAVLTHMNHEMDYDTMLRELPAGVVPAYDGMVLDIPA